MAASTDLVSLLEDVADYLEPYADADGGPDGYKPNAAMSLGLRVENEIGRLKSSNGPEGEALRRLFAWVDSRADQYNEERKDVDPRVVRDLCRYIASELNAILNARPATSQISEGSKA